MKPAALNTRSTLILIAAALLPAAASYAADATSAGSSTEQKLEQQVAAVEGLRRASARGCGAAA